MSLSPPLLLPGLGPRQGMGEFISSLLPPGTGQ